MKKLILVLTIALVSTYSFAQSKRATPSNNSLNSLRVEFLSDSNKSDQITQLDAIQSALLEGDFLIVLQKEEKSGMRRAGVQKLREALVSTKELIQDMTVEIKLAEEKYMQDYFNIENHELAIQIEKSKKQILKLKCVRNDIKKYIKEKDITYKM